MTEPQDVIELAERHLDRRNPPPGHAAYREPELPASEWRAAYFVLARIALEQLDECRAALVRTPETLRDWQRDLLTFDADGRTLDQVVADLLGVKSVNLRTEQDNEGNATSEDRRWRVQYFGGTYGGTLFQCRDSASADVPAPDPGAGLRTDADMDREAPGGLVRLQDENAALRRDLDGCIAARDALADDEQAAHDTLNRVPATAEQLQYINPNVREDAYNKGVRDLAEAIAAAPSAEPPETETT